MFLVIAEGEGEDHQDGATSSQSCRQRMRGSDEHPTQEGRSPSHQGGIRADDDDRDSRAQENDAESRVIKNAVEKKREIEQNMKVLIDQVSD